MDHLCGQICVSSSPSFDTLDCSSTLDWTYHDTWCVCVCVCRYSVERFAKLSSSDKHLHVHNIGNVAQLQERGEVGGGDLPPTIMITLDNIIIIWNGLTHHEHCQLHVHVATQGQSRVGQQPKGHQSKLTTLYTPPMHYIGTWKPCLPMSGFHQTSPTRELPLYIPVCCEAGGLTFGIS